LRFAANGNPQDGSGICFSKANHGALEGCGGYLGAAGGLGEGASATTGGPPAGGGTGAGAVVRYGLDRGKSPTLGCKQCSAFGTFQYTIYDPPAGHPVYNRPMPGLGWANSSLFSFWGSPFDRPRGVRCNASDGVPRLSRAAGAVVHMFHGGLWGGWQFQVRGQDAAAGTLAFGYGGYQEARGSGIRAGQRYYLENDLALLDAPGEWYFDPAGRRLYYWPNATAGGARGAGRAAAGMEVVAPLLDSVVRIEHATDVSFVGFEFTETRATYLSQYEVPSGGDCELLGASTRAQTSKQTRRSSSASR
jgi:hypothetical protein